MKQIKCETEFRKTYFKKKNAAQALLRIMSETENVVNIENLHGYTPDKLKFHDGLLDCIEERKKFSYFRCPNSKEPALKIRKNGCEISIYYNEDILYFLPIDIIKIQVSGSEENVKQEREALRNLL